MVDIQLGDGSVAKIETVRVQQGGAGGRWITTVTLDVWRSVHPARLHWTLQLAADLDAEFVGVDHQARRMGARAIVAAGKRFVRDIDGDELAGLVVFNPRRTGFCEVVWTSAEANDEGFERRMQMRVDTPFAEADDEADIRAAVTQRARGYLAGAVDHLHGLIDAPDNRAAFGKGA